MAVEMNVPIDATSLEIPAVLVNKFHIVGSPTVFRIAFGEAVGGRPPTIYKTAVAMEAGDVKELVDALTRLLEQVSKPLN